MTVTHFPAGNYRFLAAPGRPFSSGVVADDGYALVRATFDTPLPLGQGLEAARRHVEAAGRPVTAIGAFELRSPRPFTQEGFDSFNVGYVERLAGYGLTAVPDQPTARTNVAPTIPGIGEPSVYSFTYTVPGDDLRPQFRLSGSAETRRTGDDVDRLRSIIETLAARMAELGVAWELSTVIHLYGATPPPSGFEAEFVSAFGRAALHGVTWFPSLPPVEGLHFELDARRVATEIVL